MRNYAAKIYFEDSGEEVIEQVVILETEEESLYERAAKYASELEGLNPGWSGIRFDQFYTSDEIQPMWVDGMVVFEMRHSIEYKNRIVESDNQF